MRFFCVYFLEWPLLTIAKNSRNGNLSLFGFFSNLVLEKPAAPTRPEDDSYYYYQTSDCGNMFLSAINAKCLITQYGSLKDAPDSFSAKMLEIDDYTMDQVNFENSHSFKASPNKNF